MRLSELNNNETAIVTKVDLGVKDKARLLELGLTEGVSVTLLRKSVFGDPIEINLRGFNLAIRVDVAKKISVEKL